MKTWEYMILNLTSLGPETRLAHTDKLNALGEEGWEVVEAVLVNPDNTPGAGFSGCYRSLLKREKTTELRQATSDVPQTQIDAP